MKIHDPALFAVVVPTFDGTRFLRRMLDYFRHLRFEGRIVLSDNSSGAHRDFVTGCAGEYADLRIETHAFPPDIRFLDKMVETLETTDTRFVMLHAHDDFMVPDAVEHGVEFLAGNPDYGVARGRVAMFALSRSGSAHAGRIEVSLMPHPMRGYEQDDAADRVVSHIERYASTFYSIHRRQDLLESFRLTETATKNVIFFQYLSSCISALKGKIWCSDEMFYIRQGHADSWSGTLKQGDYEHWPMLITSPKFSQYYAEFRSALSRLMEQDLGIGANEAGSRIDRAALGLFQRSYCGQEIDNPAELQFAQRLKDPGSGENKALTSVVEFSVKYPDTF